MCYPERIATQNSWERNPTLDLVVQDGCISLHLRRQVFGTKKFLESIITDEISNKYHSLENYILEKNIKKYSKDKFKT